ncbi:MAG: sigma 54-interacting transcriptional regulator [Rubrivivax sp.]|nr:sigma 54-interacting transcriptional regulator [Rubrivivax sp.]
MAPPSDFAPADLDAERVVELAAKSLFDVFNRTAMGTMVVDRSHRIVWISEGYKRFLPALGHEESDFVGRRVEEVVPNTLMGQVIESGRPILVDLLTNQAGTFLVSRLPLKNDAGEVIGAVGYVLLDHPETTMQPLLAKFAQLQGELEAARREIARARRPKHSIASFVGASAQALEVKRLARRVALTDSPVLLLGETGTGKELLAHGIHAASRRAARPLVSVNIAAVPDTLLEAEFFGVAPGAYTGAERKGREGKFKLADGGTLFLDEIGDMPLALQAKLLRALQEQEIEPLGSNRVERVDVRVIAATSRDLAAMVADGSFRADLFYRLNVLPIRVPPLRERPADLEALVEALGEDIARRSGMAQKGVGPDALDLLAAHRWPGNVRELRNVLEQATLMTDEAQLTARHFAAALALAGPGGGGAGAGDAGGHDAVVAPAVTAATASAPAQDRTLVTARAAGGPGAASMSEDAAAAGALSARAEPAATRLRPLADQVAEVEDAAITAALEATGGNRVAAAKLLRMSRAALYARLARQPRRIVVVR